MLCIVGLYITFCDISECNHIPKTSYLWTLTEKRAALSMVIKHAREKVYLNYLCELSYQYLTWHHFIPLSHSRGVVKIYG